MHLLLENVVLGQTPFWKMKFSKHVSVVKWLLLDIVVYETRVSCK